MNFDDRVLLPNGIFDTVYPQAFVEWQASNMLLSEFHAFGYRLVNPPLMEFENTLLSASDNKETNENTFRVMDSKSYRMMGIRSDMTPQIARLASTCLKNEPRPLRLMYSGDVLHVKGSVMRPQRSFKQYGVELVGVDNADADTEVILLSLQALEKAGVKKLSVDINIPLLPKLSADSVGVEFSDVAVFIEKRDASALEKCNGIAGEVLSSLVKCTGRADRVLPKLQALPLNDMAMGLINRTREILEILQNRLSEDVLITIDACETRGFSFQTGIGFTLFSGDARGELGRGGRYVLEATQESCVGFSIYSDGLMSVLPVEVEEKRIFAPYNTQYEDISVQRKNGNVIICGFDDDNDVYTSAKVQKCTHILIDNEIIALN